MFEQTTAAGTGGDVPGAISDAREEVLVRFTRGQVVTEPSFKFFSVTADIYKLDGSPDGVYEGEYQLTAPPADLFLRPVQPIPPFDVPQGPVDHITINAYTKGRWKFADGSSILAMGTANFHAVKVSSAANAPVKLWVTGNQIITGGTGQFDGVQGLKILSGACDLPSLPAQPGQLFPAQTVDAFRIIRASDIAKM